MAGIWVRSSETKSLMFGPEWWLYKHFSALTPMKVGLANEENIDCLNWFFVPSLALCLLFRHPLPFYLRSAQSWVQHFYFLQNEILLIFFMVAEMWYNICLICALNNYMYVLFMIAVNTSLLWCICDTS